MPLERVLSASNEAGKWEYLVVGPEEASATLPNDQQHPWWPNAEQFQHIGYCLVVAMFFIPMVLFVMLGFWTLRGQLWALLLTAGPIVYFSLIHMVFVGSLRYRLPAEYPLCVLTAVGINTILSARRNAS